MRCSSEVHVCLPCFDRDDRCGRHVGGDGKHQVGHLHDVDEEDGIAEPPGSPGSEEDAQGDGRSRTYCAGDEQHTLCCCRRPTSAEGKEKGGDVQPAPQVALLPTKRPRPPHDDTVCEDILPATCQISVSSGARSAVVGQRTLIITTAFEIDEKFSMRRARTGDGLTKYHWRRRKRLVTDAAQKEAESRNMKIESQMSHLAEKRWLRPRLLGSCVSVQGEGNYG